jgi:Family of unknown function (DUF6521)
MLLPWLQRPIEVANLFNPAFCALLVHQAVKSYELETGRGMSYSTAFVVLPVVLHKGTRELLPHSIATKLHAWLQTNEQVRVGFAERMQQMTQLTREGLLFAMQHQALVLDKAGAMAVGPRKLGKLDVDKESETALCVKKAEFVGRWFASVPNPVALLALWGIKLQ